MYKIEFYKHNNYYYKIKELTIELITNWFIFENYKYLSFHNESNTRLSDSCVRFDLECPNNHKFNINVSNWKNGSRCNICKLQKYYNENNCTIVYDPITFPDNTTIHIVPYKCSYGHLIDNLTKNCFNARINQKLEPCAKCSEENLLIERINNIDFILVNKDCTLLSKDKRRICFTCATCKNICSTNDSIKTNIMH